MFSRVKTAALTGVKGYLVIVETDISGGLPSFDVVGLAGPTIKEACRRIRPAVKNCGYDFPKERITVNLVPAGKHKEGSHFDLPIALGIASMACGVDIPEDTAFLGELSLDGKVNGIKGALPLVMCVRQEGIKNVVLPFRNAEEVSVLKDINLFCVENLKEAMDYVQGVRRIKYVRENRGKSGKKSHGREEENDFSQVAGNETAKRALTVAAAGNHGLLMLGGPGCGKTMMAKRIPSILPELSYEEKLEITGIYSIAGMLSEDAPIVEKPPFRCPHHSISKAGLIGGGAKPRPGEISLAHRGVLFLDELGEFEPKTIDAMRKPAEEGFIKMKRNMEEILFPADVMIVAAANPCKCGYLWDNQRACVCSQRQLDSHRRKLTGPFADRIDMHIKVMPVPADFLLGGEAGQKSISSAQMREAVKNAKRIQKERYREKRFSDNGKLDEKNIALFCGLSREGAGLMAEAYEKLNLSMRAYNKVLKVSRTIADINGRENIETEDISEALMYRISNWE